MTLTWAGARVSECQGHALAAHARALRGRPCVGPVGPRACACEQKRLGDGLTASARQTGVGCVGWRRRSTLTRRPRRGRALARLDGMRSPSKSLGARARPASFAAGRANLLAAALAYGLALRPDRPHACALGPFSVCGRALRRAGCPRADCGALRQSASLPCLCPSCRM